ncbi:MAG TPA: O-methyltransferase [Humisphaera sp.]
MSEQLWSEVDRYYADLLVGPDPALDAAVADSAAAGLPDIQVTPTQGKLLHLLARTRGARRILEVGTLGGYSAIWLARALPPGGRLVTLEIDSARAELARRNVVRAGLSAAVDVRVGSALDTLPKLAAESAGPFDLVFIDADKSSTPDYFAWAMKLTAPGSLIVVDNVVRKGKVLDAASTDASIRGIRRFNEMLAAEPRVSATVVQTVGGKGHDGFAVALVIG